MLLLQLQVIGVLVRHERVGELVDGRACEASVWLDQHGDALLCSRIKDATIGFTRSIGDRHHGRVQSLALVMRDVQSIAREEEPIDVGNLLDDACAIGLIDRVQLLDGLDEIEVLVRVLCLEEVHEEAAQRAVVQRVAQRRVRELLETREQRTLGCRRITEHQLTPYADQREYLVRTLVLLGPQHVVRSRCTSK